MGGGKVHPCRTTVVALHQAAVAGRIHFWPFDGSEIPEGRSVMAEVYPRLFRQETTPEGLTDDQRDAYAVAAWMRRADLDGSFGGFFNPPLSPSERKIAQIEGWILEIRLHSR